LTHANNLFSILRMNLITQAVFDAGSYIAIARHCCVTYQAVKRWERTGRLPRTDLTGETDYAGAIARATKGKVKRKALLDQTRAAWNRAA
jgi:hypothetical protein